MPMLDPNVLLSIMQGVQGGSPLTEAQGISSNFLPRMNSFLGNMPDQRLGSAITSLQAFVPTWQQGEHWRLRDAFGGMSGGEGHWGTRGMRGLGGPGPGMGGTGPGGTPGTGGMGGGHMGLRGRGGK